MYIPENVHRYSHSSEYEYCTPRRVHFFGQFQLFWYDQSLCKLIWRRNKAKTLLQWFLLNPGKLYAAEQLTDLFWNELDEEAATRNLHVTIHYLRHLLEPDLPLRQESTFLRRNKNNFYWLELDDTWWVDIFDVHHLYTDAISMTRRVKQQKQSSATVKWSIIAVVVSSLENALNPPSMPIATNMRAFIINRW